MDDATLARSITRAANTHAFTTIRLFVDRRLSDDAFRAYAYFRWVDDRLDRGELDRDQAQVFLDRQRRLIDSAYAGESVAAVQAEEEMVLSLIQRHPDPASGLAAYIRNLMRVMAFDAGRRGRLIGARDLAGYTGWLAAGVTEALHYFIGGPRAGRRSPARDLPAMGAHIAHMLRDTAQDVAGGYFNIPVEVLRRERITPEDIDSAAYRSWARRRVDLARRCLRLGRAYLGQVPSVRLRVASLAYCFRFERALDRIERAGFSLSAQDEPSPAEREGLTALVAAVAAALLPPASVPLTRSRVEPDEALGAGPS